MNEYLTIVVDLWDDEVLAIIHVSDNDDEKTVEYERAAITKQLGHDNWIWGDEITEAEFGTYQAFGIREIKL